MRIIQGYRGDPKFVRQRLDRVAGHVNVYLTVIAIGLGAFDILYAAHKITSEWPPLAVAGVNASATIDARDQAATAGRGPINYAK